MIGRIACLLALALPAPLYAESLPLPATAMVTDSLTTPSGTLALATGPWTAATGTPQRNVAGAVSQTAYRVAGPALQTRDLLLPLRNALLQDGYTVLFECEGAACGGFDFRYDLAVLPEPAMHVNLGDFRYLSAVRTAGQDGEEAVALIVSRSANAGFVQVSRAGAGADAPPLTLSTASDPVLPLPPAPVSPASPALVGDMGANLETGGALPLDDLQFPSGAAVLAPGDYASLAALATYLSANPNRRIAIVGHTDASGPLAGNIALSRRRAESVRRVLIDQLGVRAAQVEAEGVGYLSPRASNLTEAGRAANRRVEVMLTNTE